MTASANVTPLIERSPSPTVSVEKKPSMAPLPYSMENLVPLGLYVELFDESYFGLSKHHEISEHLELGTHRLDDPVSNTTSNVVPGVPIVISP